MTEGSDQIIMTEGSDQMSDASCGLSNHCPTKEKQTKNSSSWLKAQVH